jgi:hypothetical protein
MAEVQTPIAESHPMVRGRCAKYDHLPHWVEAGDHTRKERMPDGII